jgi:hypothetical protein
VRFSSYRDSVRQLRSQQDKLRRAANANASVKRDDKKTPYRPKRGYGIEYQQKLVSYRRLPTVSAAVLVALSTASARSPSASAATSSITASTPAASTITPAPAVASASTPPAESAATATAAALRTLLRCVDLQRSSFKLSIVGLCNRLIGVFHLDKAESAGSSGHLIVGDLDRQYLAILREQSPDRLLGARKR